MKNLFDVRNLCFSYYRQPLCVNDASFVVEENQKLVVAGIKDSGKTTLLKAMSSFDETYYGQIFYKGKDLKKYVDEEKNFSLLFSEPVLLNSTIEKNFNYVCDVSKIKRLTEVEMVELLEKFKINQKPTQKIKKLSLLEKRKLAFARAWLKVPDVWFVDDQFCGLTEEEMLEMKCVYDLIFELKTTMIFALENLTIKNNLDYFNSKFNAVVLLNYSKIYKYKSIKEMLSKKVNVDVLECCLNMQTLKGVVLKNNGAYYFSLDEKNLLKFDKVFYDKLSMLALTEGECEDVFLSMSSDFKFDENDNEMFNKRLKNKDSWLFSALDGSKII